jgi:NADH-quinone oxidoreductase subunit J
LLHSTLALICHLIAVAGLFGLLGAEFVAAVQVLLYASAVIILILFALLLLDSRTEVLAENDHLFVVASVVVGVLILFFILPVAAVFVGEVLPFEVGDSGGVISIGGLLFSRYVIPFQLVGVLIIVALVAVVMLGQAEVDADISDEAVNDS